jgi:hypothetical protein
MFCEGELPGCAVRGPMQRSVEPSSFLNMVASAVTLGIYSPMTITVQCASAREDADANALRIPESTSFSAAVQVFNEAVRQAAASGEPVLVLFE